MPKVRGAFDPGKVKFWMKRVNERIVLLCHNNTGDKQSHGSLFRKPAISNRP